MDSAALIKTSLQQPTDQNPAAVYLAGLAVGSRRTMREALDRIARISSHEQSTYYNFPWQLLRFQHTTALRHVLADTYSYTTTNKMLSALRGVLQASWKLGQMSAEDYHQAASIPNVRGQRLPAGRALATQELEKLLAGCQEEGNGIRDGAIVMVLYGCGLRRAEVVSLNLRDYDSPEQTLRVRGKGNKERLVPVIEKVATWLGRWLAVRGQADGPLFWGSSGRNQQKRLTTQAIYQMLQQRANLAGLERLSPHDFRRTFVSTLLDRGADIVTVQKLAGHASVETTGRYDRRGEKAKRKAVDLLQG